MTKYSLFLMIFFFPQVFIFGMEYRYNFGLSYYYDSQNIDSAKEADHLLVDYSYEILSHPLDYCNLSAISSATSKLE